MAADPRPKILALLAKDAELDQQKAAIRAEMLLLLNGGEGIGVKLNAVIRCWCETWQERHHEPFDFDGAMRRQHTAWLKEKILSSGVEVVTAKIVNFILGPERAAAEARHPFGWFRKCYQTVRGVPSDEAQRDDATTSKLRELRGE